MGKGRTDYVRIPIVDAARRCGVTIKDGTLGRKEVEAACPFCGDKQNRHHLFLNTVKDQYHCKLCGAGGNSVSLYARLNNISFAEAAEDLMSQCKIYPMPLPPQGASTPEREPKPISERHDVFYEMLNHLALSDNHLSNLRCRGLSDERIARNMYRTLPQSEAARRFLAGMLAGFHDLSGIPGFYKDKDGYWTIAGKGGLLIPVCDKGGYIQGLQVRLDEETLGENGRRYRWLSSRYENNGTRSGNWIHVTGNASSKTAYLTEGPLKGDVASYHDNDALFICIAGINSTDGLTGVIRSLGVSEIILAADMDKVTNKQVRDGFEKIAKAISQIRGVRISTLNWNVCFKGIDDYYNIRRRASEKGKIMDIRGNDITAYVQSLWEREYPEQQAQWIGSCEWEETVRPLDELRYGKPRDMDKARYYKQKMETGEKFPPLIVINDIVIDGLHRCRAYAEKGTEYVRVYQNKPYILQEAA